MLRRALSGLSLVVLATAVALVPGTASAAPSKVAVTDARVLFSSPTAASVSIAYTCGSTTAAPTQRRFYATAYQPLAELDYRAAADTVEEGVPVTCDGTRRTARQVPLQVTEGTFGDGPAEIAMLIEEDGADVVYQLVTAVGISGPVAPSDPPTQSAPPAPPTQSAPPAPPTQSAPPAPPAPPTQSTPPAPPAPVVALTTNAAPEPARKGKKITVKGTVARDAKAIKVKATLWFAQDGGAFTKVKTVKSSAKGRLSTSVKAARTGSYAYGYDGVVSARDRVEIIPAVKKYKSCSSLNKVYAHGVGKKGAVDKGGAVTGFTVDADTYKKNARRDGDKDGIACEKA